ncbi:glutaredoxin domain-containing protein [Nonomuraea sp. NPDC049504]|uniref:glutaredoxin domain-containing protein n=1 Tax=Nonomuraea sp. NPDC049504 TaxID=3154729 RepID=UPI0034214A37
MSRRWKVPGLLLALGVAIAAWQVTKGDLVPAVVVLVVYALLGLLLSPLAFPRPVDAGEARRRSAADGRAIVYWRPGCRYCMRLRLRLGRAARRAYWVDIWRDPEGAAAVRAITGGDETVPTVVLAGEPHVNPHPKWLRDQLR